MQANISIELDKTRFYKFKKGVYYEQCIFIKIKVL